MKNSHIKIISVFIALLMITLIFASNSINATNPDSELDQRQPYIERTHTIHLKDEKYAQQFTPTLNRLDYVKIFMARDTDTTNVGYVKISITESLDAEALGETSIPVTSIDVGTSEWYILDFDDNNDIKLKPDHSYYIIWELTDDQPDINDGISLSFSSSDRYSGDCYLRNYLTGEWELKNDRDLSFETWGYYVEYEPQWTFIGYMCGSYNLGRFARDCLDFIDNVVGAEEDVNIVVLLDDEGGSDTQACYISGNSQRITISLRDINPSWSNEVNMGDPQVLISFVNYCITNFPAEQYLINLFDHGGSFLGCCWDDSGDNLDIDDLDFAFSTISNILGKKVDVVFFNACLMNAVEIANQLEPYVDFQVGSETVSWSSSCDGEYETFLQHLIDNPDKTPKGLANYITRQQHLENNWAYRTQCVSTIDLSKMEELKDLIDDLADNLRDNIDGSSFYNKLQTARDNSEYMEGPSGGQIERLIDLYDFCENLDNEIGNSVTRAIAQDIMDLIGSPGGETDKVITEERHTNAASFCHGLSIYFPDRANRYDSARYNMANNFASQTEWNEFLNDFLNSNIREGTGWDAIISASGEHGCVYFTFGEEDEQKLVQHTNPPDIDTEIYSKNGNNKYKVHIKETDGTRNSWDVYVKWKGSAKSTVTINWDVDQITTDLYSNVYIYDYEEDEKIYLRNTNSFDIELNPGEVRHLEIVCSNLQTLTANANGPYSGKKNKAISFKGTATGGEEPYEYHWDFNNDGNTDKTGKEVSYTFTEAKTQTAKLTITDNNEESASDTFTITISKGRSKTYAFNSIIQKIMMFFSLFEKLPLNLNL